MTFVLPIPMAIRTVPEGHKKVATPTGFEPVRAEPTHLAGERLNHSAKASLGCTKE